MKPLFDDTPQFDPHVVSILNYMLSHLRNNSPKPTSNVYLRNASYVKEIYDGTFIQHGFEYSNQNEYNLDGILEKVRDCKHSWQKTRDIIIASITHFEMAKEKDCMPLNKKYLETVTFGTFFEGYIKFNPNGYLDSNFMKFVNEPKKSFAYFANLSMNKIKSETPEPIKSSAENFSKKWFKIPNVALSFWNNISDFSRWLKKFKSSFPKVYSEFLLACIDGDPFKDLSTYILNSLQNKQGQKPILNAYYFKLSGESGQLEGMFRNWLRDGITNGKFNCLNKLPKSIVEYCSDESFEEKAPSVKKEKKVVNADEFFQIYN